MSSPNDLDATNRIDRCPMDTYKIGFLNFTLDNLRFVMSGNYTQHVDSAFDIPAEEIENKVVIGGDEDRISCIYKRALLEKYPQYAGKILLIETVSTAVKSSKLDLITKLHGTSIIPNIDPKYIQDVITSNVSSHTKLTVIDPNKSDWDNGCAVMAHTSIVAVKEGFAEVKPEATVPEDTAEYINVKYSATPEQVSVKASLELTMWNTSSRYYNHTEVPYRVWHRSGMFSQLSPIPSKEKEKRGFIIKETQHTISREDANILTRLEANGDVDYDYLRSSVEYNRMVVVLKTSDANIISFTTWGIVDVDLDAVIGNKVVKVDNLNILVSTIHRKKVDKNVFVNLSSASAVNVTTHELFDHSAEYTIYAEQNGDVQEVTSERPYGEKLGLYTTRNGKVTETSLADLEKRGWHLTRTSLDDSINGKAEKKAEKKKKAKLMAKKLALEESKAKALEEKMRIMKKKADTDAEQLRSKMKMEKKKADVEEEFTRARTDKTSEEAKEKRKKRTDKPSKWGGIFSSLVNSSISILSVAKLALGVLGGALALGLLVL